MNNGLKIQSNVFNDYYFHVQGLEAEFIQTSKMKNIFLILFLIFSLSACQSNGSGESTTANAAQSHLLSPQDFQEKLARTEGEILIDLRTHGELHSIGPIAGAGMMDFTGGQFEKFYPNLPKEKPIFLYCASGGRSGKAYDILKGAGFETVYDMDGGITAWKSAGLPVQSHSH